MKLKLFDIVKVKGVRGLAMIDQVSASSYSGRSYSIIYLSPKRKIGAKLAWLESDEIEYVDNVNQMLKGKRNAYR